MYKFLARLTLVGTIALTACAMTPQGSWYPPADANLAKDDLECRAMANQAAMGAGGWTSVSPVQAAIRDTAAERYYDQCVQSRGYQWVTPR